MGLVVQHQAPFYGLCAGVCGGYVGGPVSVGIDAGDIRPRNADGYALLEKNNYAVDAVYDGAEALAYLEAGNYDALVLDIMMPKLDGLEVLRRLREAGNPIPVLLLTAKSEVEDKVRGLDTGANDYLTKPFSTAELMARIRAMSPQPGRRPGLQPSFLWQYHLGSDHLRAVLPLRQFSPG